jgi:hypothetical protein
VRSGTWHFGSEVISLTTLVRGVAEALGDAAHNPFPRLCSPIGRQPAGNVAEVGTSLPWSPGIPDEIERGLLGRAEAKS